MTLLKQLSGIVEMDPDHDEAVAALEIVTQEAERRAEVALLKARSLGPKRLNYVKLLKDAIRFDPQGEKGTVGRKAAELLAKPQTE